MYPGLATFPGPTTFPGALSAMARTSVTTQPVVRAGLNPTLTAPTVDGDIVDCGNVALWVDNAGAAPIGVVVQATVAQDGLNLEDLTVSVPAGAARLIGPLPGRTFAQAQDATVGAGRALVDYPDGVTSVTRAVISI